jgi:hypothetical protein
MYSCERKGGPGMTLQKQGAELTTRVEREKRERENEREETDSESKRAKERQREKRERQLREERRKKIIEKRVKLRTYQSGIAWETRTNGIISV